MKKIAFLLLLLRAVCYSQVITTNGVNQSIAWYHNNLDPYFMNQAGFHAFTIELWCYIQDITSAHDVGLFQFAGGPGMVIQIHHGTDDHPFMQYHTSDGGDSYNQIESPDKVLYNQWVHYAMTWNDVTGANFYVNGKIKASSNHVQLAWGTDYYLHLGDSSYYAVKAYYDEVRCWSVCRSSAEINQTMSISIRNDYPGLIFNLHGEQDSVTNGKAGSYPCPYDSTRRNNCGSSFTAPSALSISYDKTKNAPVKR